MEGGQSELDRCEERLGFVALGGRADGTAARIPVLSLSPTLQTLSFLGGTCPFIQRGNLKSSKRKTATYKGTHISLPADFSTETFQARRDWHEIFKVMKSQDLQHRLLYPPWL